MSESDFNERVDATLEQLEDALDALDSDLDYVVSGGVLTVNFENGSTMVFSRQPPTQQLWLAARSGGYHFVFDNDIDDWRDTRSGLAFRPFVVEQVREQAGIDFGWCEG